MTKAELARRTHVPDWKVYGIFSGKTQPSDRFLAAFADEMGLSYLELSGMGSTLEERDSLGFQLAAMKASRDAEALARANAEAELTRRAECFEAELLRQDDLHNENLERNVQQAVSAVEDRLRSEIGEAHRRELDDKEELEQALWEEIANLEAKVTSLESQARPVDSALREAMM